MKACDPAPADDAQDEPRRADRGASQVGCPLGHHVGGDVARRVLGRGRAAARRSAVRQAGQQAPDYIGSGTAPATDSCKRSRAVSDSLTTDFGSWKTPWGDINRFQRLNDDIVARFVDTGSSIPVPFTAATWGSLASFAARPYPGTKKRYGTAATASWPLWSSATGCTPGPSRPGARAETRSRRTSMMKPRGMPPATCARWTSPQPLKGHTEREYHPEIELP